MEASSAGLAAAASRRARRSGRPRATNATEIGNRQGAPSRPGRRRIPARRQLRGVREIVATTNEPQRGRCTREPGNRRADTTTDHTHNGRVEVACEAEGHPATGPGPADGIGRPRAGDAGHPRGTGTLPRYLTRGECKPLSKGVSAAARAPRLPRSWRTVARCQPDPPAPLGQNPAITKMSQAFSSNCPAARTMRNSPCADPGRGEDGRPWRPLQLKYAIPNRDPPPEMAAGEYYARSQLSGSSVRCACKSLKLDRVRSAERALSAVSDLRRARAGGGAMHRSLARAISATAETSRKKGRHVVTPLLARLTARYIAGGRMLTVDRERDDSRVLCTGKDGQPGVQLVARAW